MSTSRVVLAPHLLQKLSSKKQPMSCTNPLAENLRESGTPEKRRHSTNDMLAPIDYELAQARARAQAQADPQAAA